MASPAWSFGLSTEARAVLAWGLPSSVDGAVERLDDDRWRHLRADVDRHRLTGLLVAAVADGSVATTDDQAAEIGRLEVDLTLARLWQESRFGSIVEGLVSAGVEARVLKGAALAALDYPDAQLRPTADLDLLVRGRDIEVATTHLAALGGRRTDPDPTPGYAAVVGKGATISLPDGLEVDLHRTLVWGPFGVRIVTDDLWVASRSFDHGGRELTTTELEVSLLHACYHLLVLGFRRALSARDVAQLLLQPSLDVDRVLWLARRWSGEAALAAGVVLTVDQLGLEVEGVLVDWARGYVPRLRDRLWLRVERPEDQVGPLEPIVTYLALRTPAERAVLRRATVSPVPGTWLSPPERARRVQRRLRDLAPAARR